jgi:outer membrane protein OmpA-like peptidoglycan-associated protein
MMNLLTIRDRVLFQLLLGAFAVAPCLSQTSALTGSVSDALNESPIAGVSVVVPSQPLVTGVTGPDGHYAMTGLKRGAKIILIYDKGGYARYTTAISVSGRRITRDVSLFKDTADAAYWSSWSQKLGAASKGNEKVAVANAWKEIGNTNLSAGSKVVAAKNLLSVLPSKEAAPEDLVAVARETQPDTEEYAHHAIEENSQRFAGLAEYNVKGETTVKFGVGSSKISASDQEELKNLVQAASGLNGYIILVKGYADSTGNAVMTTKLSEDRAEAVVSFLMQGGVPVRHIIAPGAMGEYAAAESNETKTGRAENRKVEVRILVNKSDIPQP